MTKELCCFNTVLAKSFRNRTFPYSLQKPAPPLANVWPNRSPLCYPCCRKSSDSRRCERRHTDLWDNLGSNPGKNGEINGQLPHRVHVRCEHFKTFQPRVKKVIMRTPYSHYFGKQSPYGWRPPAPPVTVSIKPCKKQLVSRISEPSTVWTSTYHH